MKLNFHKYQSTGNDFVILNGFANHFDLITPQIQLMCDRRFGIGADGLMILKPHNQYDFEMVYYNSDGRESTMCGNGGRALVKFAHHIGLISHSCRFTAIDGEHTATVEADGSISLGMIDVKEIEDYGKDQILFTGSPHYVHWVQQLDQIAFIQEAKKIRHNQRFNTEGINVNFVMVQSDFLEIRTFERGVEDETYSCGTGVTASALAAAHHIPAFFKHTKIDIVTKGGNLSVIFDKHGKGYKNIYLQGPSELVFSGNITLP